MREINFRAWNKAEKEMIINPIVNDINSATRYMGLNSLFKKFEDKGFILMQFTGLKDKNGKDIFEGDIVRAVNGWDGNKLIGEIIFVPYAPAYGVILPDGSYLDFVNDIVIESSEVIGNVYENPDLLAGI